MNEKDYKERFMVMGVVKGAHYELNWQNESYQTTHDDAYKLMLAWKNSFNESIMDGKPFFMSGRLGVSADMVRVDTIEKMYVKRMLVQRNEEEYSGPIEPSTEIR